LMVQGCTHNDYWWSWVASKMILRGSGLPPNFCFFGQPGITKNDFGGNLGQPKMILGLTWDQQ
jgi:hypothetical protein